MGGQLYRVAIKRMTKDGLVQMIGCTCVRIAHKKAGIQLPKAATNGLYNVAN